MWEQPRGERSEAAFQRLTVTAKGDNDVITCMTGLMVHFGTVRQWLEREPVGSVDE